jgi:hypothetical protein
VSWDIFVQDLPSNIRSMSEIPADFVPGTLPVTKSQIISAIRAVAPFADFPNQTWGTIKSGKRCLIEVSLGKDEVLKGFTFHVHGGDLSVIVIAEVLQRLSLRALDPGSESGVFEGDASAASFERWRHYKNEILTKGSA